MRQKNIQEIWDVALFLQMMAAFCDDIDFDEYMSLMHELHSLIKDERNDVVEIQILSYRKRLKAILDRIILKYPPKREFGMIATDWNSLFVENKEILNYGVSVGWLEKQVDLTNYYKYNYVPYHFKVGLAINKGRGEIEENFILQDSFTSLVKAKRLLRKLEDEANEFKRTVKYTGTNRFNKQTLDYINFVKYDVSFYSRISIISFFSFLESFVNSIGYDYYYRNKINLAERESEILQGGKKGRFLNLKYKIESFQKIIRSDKKAIIVLSDDNQIVEPFKSLFDYYEELRNSSVHFSPIKTRIWLKPHDWVDKSEKFSKLVIEAALLIWKCCHETETAPDYLGRLEYDRLYKIAEQRDHQLYDTR